MVEFASHLTDEDIRTAADYFSKQVLRRRVEVRESKKYPCVNAALWIYIKIDGCEDKPLGTQLVEFAPNKTPHELRDESMVYVAIVPVGSIARGRALSHEGGAALACETCHGEKLRGTDIAPSLAGRSPTTLLRQLLAFQQHTRAGEGAVLMQPVVENMSMGDMIAAAAYAASLDP
jgi:cytochrome c553